MADASFKDYVLDQLKSVGGVAARAMFGGFGIYKGGVMFGLIADDGLYFKVSDENQADYVARKSGPFIYESAGRKPITMSYWKVPVEVLEDVDEARAWAIKAYDVALKARKDSGKQPKPRRMSHAGPRPRRR
ncbi:MAG: TfoX/Sxy family protein [Alphaproteobacteria bacterium]|nr:TfoX/Sxy family protein [Alphaproteobacteria bacterium]